MVLGLVLGLVIAEAVFHLRDDGAFPHLNLYVEDPTLGVRLAPNATTRIKLGDNPATTIHTNARGLRGEAWAAPASGEVLVVGDSQVFGLGVEDGETFSAQLSTLRKVNVLNAGVPTYGPAEYTALVEQLVAERRPTHVVYVLNVANDLFELSKPNAARHTVWDGWAVRAETAPTSTTAFPFRHALMNRSHLVFALRALLAGRIDVDQESAGEGTWKDIVTASTSTTPPPADQVDREQFERRRTTAKTLDELEQKLEEHVTERINTDEAFATAAKALPPLKRDDPRDIVNAPFMEGARAIDITAYQLFKAALAADGTETTLKALAESSKDPKLAELVSKRRALRTALQQSHARRAQREKSPLEQVLEKTRVACDSVKAKLLVVALPLDVMVSSDEWAKYGKPPKDLSVTRVLLDDIVKRAEAVGARGLDPTEALRKAEPGAFLKGDLHLTPKGHRALAEAIHLALDAPPKPPDELTLPEGRSWPPTEDEWRAVDEVIVKGSTAANCDTREVREWFRMVCRDRFDDGEGPPTDRTRELRVATIELQQGGHGDVLLGGSYGHRSITFPVLEGETAKLVVDWEDHQRELTIEHPTGGPPARAFGDSVAHPHRPRKEWVNVDERGQKCPRGGCSIDWSNPVRPIVCPEGMRPAGALRRCARPCDTADSCGKGSCVPWPTGNYCSP